MTQSIRLLIADDHKMVREGLKAFLAPFPGLELVGEARDGREAVELTERLSPDVVLLDMVMPVMDGVAATQAILARNPDARILIVSSFLEDEQVLAAIRVGAAGYLLKDSTAEELAAAIRAVHQGETALPPRIASLVIRQINRPAQPKDTAHLSERDIEILRMVAQGLPNQDIADRLTFSVWTVRTHITNILEKLQLENRTQAALYALRNGLAKIDQ